MGLGERRAENLHARVACELRERIGSARIAAELSSALEESLHACCRGGEQDQEARWIIACVLPRVRHVPRDEHE